MPIENFNKKLDKVLSKKKSDFLESASFQLDNRAWLDMSFEIALNILDVLEAKGWTQKQLAEKLGVSPQQVSKIVKGKENLRLSTISKLEAVLETELIYVANSEKEVERSISQSLDVFGLFLDSVIPKSSKAPKLKSSGSSFQMKENTSSKGKVVKLSTVDDNFAKGA
jgi:transcriptional regulator with XRE-family HTH domain